MTNRDVAHGRGTVWVATQTAVFLLLVLAPLRSRARWPGAVAVIGGLVATGAAAWLSYAYRSLGASHSAWVEPNDQAALVTDHAYGLVRHPIYAGWVVFAFGWSLLTRSPLALALTAGTGLFYDRRARVEEHLVEAAHPDYLVYRHRVRRFIPRIY